MSLTTTVAMETRSNKLTLRTAPATQKGRPRSYRPSSTYNKARQTHRSVGGTHARTHTHTHTHCDQWLCVCVCVLAAYFPSLTSFLSQSVGSFQMFDVIVTVVRLFSSLIVSVVGILPGNTAETTTDLL